MKELLIIWTWVAWLSAWIYSSRYELDYVIVWELNWGTIIKTHLVENWPWIKSTSWYDLWISLFEHAQGLGAQIIPWRIESIIQIDWGFRSVLKDWSSIESKAVIYATWMEHKELGIESEQRLKNKWVSYCATCDWGFYKGKVVWIVGWSDSAVKESLLLSEYASKVYVIYRGNKLKAEPINIKRLNENSKIEVIYDSNVIEVLWANSVTWVRLDTGGLLELQGLFINIWSTPNTNELKDIWINLNSKWEVITDKFGSTSIPGLFAAWDVTNNPFKQAIVSSGQGAQCAHQAYEFVRWG